MDVLGENENLKSPVEIKSITFQITSFKRSEYLFIPYISSLTVISSSVYLFEIFSLVVKQ